MRPGFYDKALDMTAEEILAYEVQASWWASWVSNDTLQSLAGVYFAWKVKRIVARFRAIKETRARVLAR